jgi:hypothetical protein
MAGDELDKNLRHTPPWFCTDIALLWLGWTRVGFYLTLSEQILPESRCSRGLHCISPGDVVGVGNDSTEEARSRGNLRPALAGCPGYLVRKWLYMCYLMG